MTTASTSLRPVAAKMMLAGLLLAAAVPASAGESASAWGTMGAYGGTTRAQESATLHETQGQTADLVSIGNNVGSMYRSVSSCGNCTYNSITGSNDSISGNTIKSTNSGSTSATGNFSNGTSSSSGSSSASGN